MSTKQNGSYDSIMAFYTSMNRTGDYGDFSWVTRRKRFALQKANGFFVGVMLDQGQKAERAWEGGRHLVDTYFHGKKGFWHSVRESHHQTLRKICRTGYKGTSYGSVFCTNKFPKWLRSAAVRMGQKYNDDPRNIWNVAPQDVEKIYDRFVEFQGIGDALAKMAQFILVRNFGIAGGKSNQHKMAVKPDVLVRRVLARCGLSKSENLRDALTTLQDLHLRRPADFDAAAWVIGREYCLKSVPRCGECPISNECQYALAQQIAAADRHPATRAAGG